jgi:8-oxo-dGTP diphosphatase
MQAVPQFGEPQPGRDYPDRPAAFGVVERDGRIALVRIEKPGAAPWHDLPGGAIDPGETEAQALVREFAEETGMAVVPGICFARADQYFVNTEGKPFDNRGGFWTAMVTGEDPAAKVEHDHTLVWMDPHAAIAALRHDAHAWAVAAWLRRVASRGANR